MPDPKAWQAPHFGSMLNGKAMAQAQAEQNTESLRTLLSQVCAPFVQGMLNAVDQLVEKEVERQVKQLRQQDQVSAMQWPHRRLSREKQQHLQQAQQLQSSQQQHQHAGFGNACEGMPFGNVFDAVKLMPCGEISQRFHCQKNLLRMRPKLMVTREDASRHCLEERCRHPVPGWHQTLGCPGSSVGNAVLRSSSRSGRSTSSEDPKPPGFGGGPAMGQNAGQEGDPLYLQWSSGQTVGERPALTPTVSPVPPNLVPCAQGMNASGVPMDGSQSPDSTGPGQAKTAVVCRHWKSKGWCRLGDECKFAHPEHKCGAGLIKKAEKEKAPTSSRPDDGQIQDKKDKLEKKAKKKGKDSKEILRGSPALTPGLVSPS
eukprot:symbB.v1.2.031207.t1/scaffold3596.1/size57580/6